MPTQAQANPAVVLVSGGMDSAVVLAIAREQGYACHALSVRYGQRHTSELDAADARGARARRGRAQDRAASTCAASAARR